MYYASLTALLGAFIFAGNPADIPPTTNPPALHAAKTPAQQKLNSLRCLRNLNVGKTHSTSSKPAFKHPIYKGEPLKVQHLVWDKKMPPVILIRGKQSSHKSSVLDILGNKPQISVGGAGNEASRN